MPAESWGQCKACKMWQIEPDAAIADETMGLCLAEKLEPYQLRVSGDSGCTIFKTGAIQRQAGASAVPPAGAD